MAFLSELSPEILGKLSSDLELKANLGSQELKRLVPEDLDCLIEISSAELKSFKKLSQKALDGLKKLISADLESLKNKPLLINSSVADLVIQRCNFKKCKEVDRLLAEKLKGLNDRMLEDEISPFFSSVAGFYEKEGADFPLFDGGLLNSLCPYIELLMGRLKTSEQKGLKADFFYNIISILDFIDFDTLQAPPLCEFIEFIKNKGFFPVYSPELPIKRSDKS